MAKGVKVKLAMKFVRWQDPDEKPPLIMSSVDNELCTGLVLKGTADMEVQELYDILKVQKEKGKKPLFVLEVVD